MEKNKQKNTGPRPASPLVSVIIPVYNVRPYLEKCIRSVSGQTYRQLEIILVDDGSTDGSGELCELRAKKDPRIRVIHTGNHGLSAARNTGLKESRGSWISYIDPDDYVGSHFIERLLETALRTKSDLVQCKVITLTAPAPENAGRNDRQRYRQPVVSPALLTDEPYISGKEYIRRVLDGSPGVCNAAWSRLYTRQIAESVVFPEGKVYEDLATLQDFLYNAERISECRTACYYHLRLRPGSITTQISFENYQDYKWALNRFLKRTLLLFPEYRDLIRFRKLWDEVSLWKTLAIRNILSDSRLCIEKKDLQKHLRKHMLEYRSLGSFRFLQVIMISCLPLLSGTILRFMQAHPGAAKFLKGLFGRQQPLRTAPPPDQV